MRHILTGIEQKDNKALKNGQEVRAFSLPVLLLTAFFQAVKQNSEKDRANAKALIELRFIQLSDVFLRIYASYT